MNEQQLFEAWKSSDRNEKQVFEKHSHGFLKLAKRQSNDVFAKIKGNMIVEGVLSLVASILFPFLFLNDPVFFWTLVVLVLAALSIGFKVYGQYWKDMKQLNESSLIDSLGKKLSILTRYLKQLKVYLYVFMPLGFAVGFSFALQEEEVNLEQAVLTAAIALPFLGLMMWLGNKYIYRLYGKHLKRIEEIYDNLTRINPIP